jgi:hypothetical protein
MDAVQALWSNCCRRQRNKGHDRTHLIGRAAELFVQHLRCPVCAVFDWKSYPDNHPSFDLTCNGCSTHFQVKAHKELKPVHTDKRLAVMGTTYTRAVSGIGSVAYLLLSYNSLSSIRCMYYVPSNKMELACFHPWNATVSNTLCTISFKKGTYTKIQFE